MKETKWTTEVAVDPPDLPDEFWERPGITPVLGEVEEAVGDEVILLINDPTEDAESFAQIDPVVLNVESGSVETEHGSLGFVLFIVQNLEDEGAPHAVWEILFDPRDEEMVAPFRLLSEQSHWHALFFGPGPEILNIFEFPNNYFLEAGLEDILNQTAESPCTDFAQAVADAHEAYSLEELYAATMVPSEDAD